MDPILPVESPDRLQQIVQQIGRSWTWFFLFGLLSLVVGLLVAAWPDTTIVTIATLFAVQLFAVGVFGVARSLALDSDTSIRVLSAVIGVLAISVGFALLRGPFQSIEIMTFVLGMYWVAHGIVDFAGGVVDGRREGRRWAMVMGILAIAMGIAVLAYSAWTPSGLALALGLWVAFFGAMEILAAIRLRRQVPVHPS